MFNRARAWITRSGRITDAAALQHFLATRSAFVSQKCTVEYCRARAGLFWSKLMLERPFLDAMEVCRWEALAAVYADLAILVEGHLRPGMRSPGQQVAAADFLAQSMAEALAAFAVPVHRAETGWDETVRALRDRLATAQLAEPCHPKEIGLISGPRLYEVMPMHTNMMTFDKELVVNSVRFQIMRVHEDLIRLWDPQAVLSDMLALASAPEQAG